MSSSDGPSGSKRLVITVEPLAEKPDDASREVAREPTEMQRWRFLIEWQRPETDIQD